MRIGRVLDASDPRVQSKPINGPRRTRSWGPEKQLLLRVNNDEGPLTSVDRSTLRSMGETPWDERPGYDGQSYADVHAEPSIADRRAEIIERMQRQHADNIGKHTPPPPKMTDPQQRLIEVRLLPELEGINRDVHAIASEWYATERDAGRMTKERATEVINRLKRHCGYEEDSWKKRADFVAPAPADEHSDPVTKEGLYRYDGHLYQVMRNKETDRLYAKLVTFVDGKKRPTLTYAKGMMKKLRVEHLVAAEEAQELTRKTGWCVFGHFLTNPVSIARGMGPRCWERYGA